MNIAAFLPFTLMDYPGKVAALVFTQGCNFSCGFCHNSSLIPSALGKTVEVQEFLAFLATRQGKLQGVVISGGEPTVQTGLIPFLSAIRALGFFIKLDTNGSNPDLLALIIQSGLVDYIAMDIKAPLEKYGAVIGGSVDVEKITASIRLILAADFLDHEFRTTAVKPCLSAADLVACGLLVRGSRRYILQSFVPQQALAPKFQYMESFRPEELVQIKEQLTQKGVHCYLR